MWWWQRRRKGEREVVNYGDIMQFNIILMDGGIKRGIRGSESRGEGMERRELTIWILRGEDES